MKVVPFPVPDSRAANLLLEKAKDANLEDVLVLGWKADGGDGEFWSDHNDIKAGQVLLLLEIAKAKITKQFWKD